MATHAYTTSALFRPAPVARSALLPARQVGPVTAAIRAVFAGQEAATERERANLDALRRAISASIERDLDRIDRCFAALDLLDGDPDLEPSLGERHPCYAVDAEGDERGRDLDLEPSLGWTNTDARDPECRFADASTDDREAGDDNGIADAAGAWQQGFGGYGGHGLSSWTGGL